MSQAVYTVGHSSRSGEEFLDLLSAYGIERLVDIRRFAASRKYPQFGREALSASLAGSHIEYMVLEALGGRRSGTADPDDPV